MVFRNVQIAFFTKFTVRFPGTRHCGRITHTATGEIASVAGATHAAQGQTPFGQLSLFNSFNNHHPFTCIILRTLLGPNAYTIL